MTSSTSESRSDPPASTSPTQRRRLVRAEDNLPPLRVVARDIAICNAVYEYRAMTANQIQKLLFPATHGNQHSMMVQAQERLKRLFHHGYLARDEQPVRLSEGQLPLIYTLDRQGAALLADHLDVSMHELDWHPRQRLGGASHLFINHLLCTNDVRVQLSISLKEAGCILVRWLDDYRLKQRQGREAVPITDIQGRTVQRAIVPDGYFHYTDGQYQFHQFLEVDLATVVGRASVSGRRDWAQKVQAYVAYQETGVYQARYEAKAFRVLVVTTSQERLENLKKVAEEEGGYKRFWFTTFDDLYSASGVSTLIWQVAGRERPSGLVE